MSRKGFTLVELLVVISIIALLLAILMPSLKMARQQAQAVVCMSNVKQLGLGMVAYELEQGLFPPSVVDGDGTGINLPEPPDGWIQPNHWYWFQYASAYIGRATGNEKKALYHCAAKRIKIPSLDQSGVSVLYGNYAVNYGICRFSNNRSSGGNNPEYDGMPLGMKHIKSPSRTLLLLDHGSATARWEHTTGIRWWAVHNSGSSGLKHFYIPGLVNDEREWFRPKVQLRPEVISDAVGGRHPKKTVNVSFCDGAVKRMKATDLVVDVNPAYADKYPWPLWRPGKTIIKRPDFDW